MCLYFINIFDWRLTSAAFLHNGFHSQKALRLNQLAYSITMESTDLSCSCNIAEAPFYKVNRRESSLGVVIDIEPCDGYSVKENIFDKLPLFIVLRSNQKTFYFQPFGFHKLSMAENEEKIKAMGDNYEIFHM